MKKTLCKTINNKFPNIFIYLEEIMSVGIENYGNGTFVYLVLRNSGFNRYTLEKRADSQEAESLKNDIIKELKEYYEKDTL